MTYIDEVEVATFGTGSASVDRSLVTEAEARKLRKEIRELEQRRVPLGFQIPQPAEEAE